MVKGYYVDESHVTGYLQKFSIKVPTIWDTDNQIFADYQVFSNPYAVVVNAAGQIDFRQNRFIDKLDTYLEKQVKNTLNQ